MEALEILLNNCKLGLSLTWSEDYVISSANRNSKFGVTHTKLYVSVFTLSTQDNVELLR